MAVDNVAGFGRALTATPFARIILGQLISVRAWCAEMEATMGSKNLGDRRTHHARNNDRLGRAARGMEDEVAKVLGRLQERGAISRFVRCEPGSADAKDGIDFRAFKPVDGTEVGRAFCVSVSYGDYREKRARCPGIPIFRLPPETKPETIEKRILGLF